MEAKDQELVGHPTPRNHRGGFRLGVLMKSMRLSSRGQRNERLVLTNI